MKLEERKRVKEDVKIDEYEVEEKNKRGKEKKNVRKMKRETEGKEKKNKECMTWKEIKK